MDGLCRPHVDIGMDGFFQMCSQRNLHFLTKRAGVKRLKTQVYAALYLKEAVATKWDPHLSSLFWNLEHNCTNTPCLPLLFPVSSTTSRKNRNPPPLAPILGSNPARSSSDPALFSPDLLPRPIRPGRDMDEVSSFWPCRKKAEPLPSIVSTEDFQRSGPPAKIGSILRDREVIFTKPSDPQTIEAFAAKKPVVECVSPSGSKLFLFERMVCVEFDSGGSATRIVAFCWVDDNGFFFSPEGFGGVDEASVRKAFDRSSEGHLSLTAVHRCRHREARARGFLNKTTWAFGWYGAAPGDLDAAAGGGEVRTNLQLLDLLSARAGQPCAHGRGLHVSAVDLLRGGASLSLVAIGAEGMNRCARVLYCALALGARELVSAGSSQSQPSSSFFHSGTDSLSRTKWYVFWDSTLGTSILPLYDVSFEVSEEGVKFMERHEKRKREEAEQHRPLHKTTRMM